MDKEFQSSIVNSDNYERFDRRDTVFGRIKTDKTAPFYRKGMYDEVDGVLDEKRGHDTFELARALGGWSVYDYFSEAFAANQPSEDNNIMEKPVLDPPAKDPEIMTRELKKAGLAYGAGDIGITEIDPRWVYSHDRSGKRIDFHSKYDYAVVLLVPIDPGPLRTSPEFSAARASAISYSKMAFLISCLSEYIRRLGFRAKPMGNDGALSIPLAVDAGLGQLGRNGLLIHPDFGSCVKICKVFTDMNLAPDDPSNPPLLESCRDCKICAEACEVGAITDRPDPVNGRVCPANNTGIVRWAVNHYKCYQFWIENGSDCSSCVAACPRTPSS